MEYFTVSFCESIVWMTCCRYPKFFDWNWWNIVLMTRLQNIFGYRKHRMVWKFNLVWYFCFRLKYMVSCVSCQTRNISTSAEAGLLQAVPPPSTAFQRSPLLWVDQYFGCMTYTAIWLRMITIQSAPLSDVHLIKKPIKLQNGLFAR